MERSTGHRVPRSMYAGLRSPRRAVCGKVRIVYPYSLWKDVRCLATFDSLFLSGGTIDRLTLAFPPTFASVNGAYPSY